MRIILVAVWGLRASRSYFPQIDYQVVDQIYEKIFCFSLTSLIFIFCKYSFNLPKSVLLRAVYADETPIGLIMTHTGSDVEDGIDCPGVFLWRFMTYPYQGKGYGRQALEKLINHLKWLGVPLLYTSCGQGEGSPEGFYRRLGFLPTGEESDHGIELVLRVDDYPLDLNLPEA